MGVFQPWYFQQVKHCGPVKVAFIVLYISIAEINWFTAGMSVPDERSEMEILSFWLTPAMVGIRPFTTV